MELYLTALKGVIEQSGFVALNGPTLVMLLVAFILLYLAIAKGFEPLLLMPIAFGCLLVNLPLSAIRMQVASAIHCLVHTMRLPDGSRKIVEIAEVLPLEQGEYRLRPLLKWHTESVGPDGQVSGRFILGEVPGFRENAALMHLELPEYP